MFGCRPAGGISSVGDEPWLKVSCIPVRLAYDTILRTVHRQGHPKNMLYRAIEQLKQGSFVHQLQLKGKQDISKCRGYLLIAVKVSWFYEQPPHLSTWFVQCVHTPLVVNHLDCVIFGKTPLPRPRVIKINNSI